MRPVKFRIHGLTHVVHLKLEGENPTGSSKDRTAAALLADLRVRGKLKPAGTIIESTSGNLGVSLAFLCRAMGYHFTAVIDPKTTAENRRRMLDLGAHLDVVDTPDDAGGYLLTRLKRVSELCAADPRYVWTDQYSNVANPRAHYTSTAPEIFAQMGGQVGSVFVAVSTGGTLAGIGRYFREMSPSTKIIGVDAIGSVIFGGQQGPRRLTGIGSSRRSQFVSPEHYDSYRLVTDKDAFLMCRELYDNASLRVGGSSGAVAFACAEHLRSEAMLDPAVCVCPDRGCNYDSTIFDDAWLANIGLDAGARHNIIDRDENGTDRSE